MNTRTKFFQGLNYLLHEDEQGEDCKRKFILLSSGCEVIRIPKSVLRTNADDFTINKIKNMMRSYPTDEELYEIFKRQNRWRYFREQLVDNIVEFGSGVKKAFKERCTSIPKLPKNNNIQYLSRNVSPVNDWKRLADDGYIKQSKYSTGWVEMGGKNLFEVLFTLFWVRFR